jgi:hypothetical protein
MTTPRERTRAVLWTRDFLREMAHGEASKLPPEALRAQARALLRHFPLRGDVQLVHLALPDWFASPRPDGEQD